MMKKLDFEKINEVISAAEEAAYETRVRMILEEMRSKKEDEQKEWNIREYVRDPQGGFTQIY